MEKGGIEKEFERRIRENEVMLTKICRVYAYDEADREDLFQEIVIQLWKSYANFKAVSKFSTWLYRIALNTAITRLRRRKDLVTSYDPSALPSQVIDENVSPDTEEKFKQLYLAIEQLTEVDKAIVILYLDERSYEEMEEILGIGQGNLRVKMNRIKDKLRQLTKNN